MGTPAFLSRSSTWLAPSKAVDLAWPMRLESAVFSLEEFLKDPLLEILPLALPPLVDLRSSIVLLSKEDAPDTLQSLVDGSKEELGPSVLDMSVVERRSVRDGDSQQAEERSEEVVHPVHQLTSM